MTLNFDGWPSKTIGHLFYASSSFVYHFVDISEFKLELQSGNIQFRSKLAIFCPVWPWNLTDDQKTIAKLFYGTSSFVYHFGTICEFKLESRSRNAEIGSKFVLTSVTLTFCMDITFVDDTMRGTLWKRCDEKTDGQTDGKAIHRAAWSQLKILKNDTSLTIC